MLRRVLAGLCGAHAFSPADRAAVEAQAAATWWRLLRSAARSGLPGAVRLRGNWPELCRGWRPPLADVLASVTVGALRTNSATRPLMELLRWRGP